VCAPFAAAWQSWPASSKREPAATCDKPASSVAGGQSIASAPAAKSCWASPSHTRRASPSADVSPFIFQLPATKGLICDRIAIVPAPPTVAHFFVIGNIRLLPPARD
jgi:hypothetical protein